MEHLLPFDQFLNEADSPLNESSHFESMVIIDMARETLKTWAITLDEMAKVAPNCEFASFSDVSPDYWETVIVGSEAECAAIAKYWNELQGGDEVVVEPYRGRRTRY